MCSKHHEELRPIELYRLRAVLELEGELDRLLLGSFDRALDGTARPGWRSRQSGSAAHSA